ncbi:LYR motif-containing protein 4 isoform X2 [Pithys albifrons albifrons]|uniref:LYR motif-containing protein 4 isoform X2 n=1 Tax=Pithys albifrons albifrons TaxID=3385563 RepID=UPI003A5CD8AA
MGRGNGRLGTGTEPAPRGDAAFPRPAGALRRSRAEPLRFPFTLFLPPSLPHSLTAGPAPAAAAPARPGPAREGGEKRPRRRGRSRPGAGGNMAASSRAQVLRLYRALLRESQRFDGYNYRTYAIRRIRDAFRENKNIKDSEKIEELVNKAKANLEVIRRQGTNIHHAFDTQYRR